MTEAQQAVTIGDVVIHPGDVIIGEFDGILVVPKEQAEQVLVRAEEIVASEEQVRREVAAGGTPMESFDKHGHI